ncbi:MAG TPA: DUF445 domain-containing protein [Caulobacteraceae bacterium]|nr:DUF445 domain-containing protein [Caulobacteraceae bacterium]
MNAPESRLALATADIPRLGDDEEAAARAALARNRALASGLLAFMTATFALTWLQPHPGFWIGLARSASEAGIIGGLADWFAVTALFRRPLGLPIPHTAVLPNNKDRIGRALGSFVERSFLTEAVLLPRLKRASAARRLAQWLAQPANAASAAGPVVLVLPQLVRGLNDPELRGFLTRVAREQLQEIDLAPVIGRSLRVLTQSGEADVLFERAIDAALQWLSANQAEIDRLVAQKSRWWIPKVVNRGIAKAIVEGAAELLDGLRQPDSDTRRRFHQALAAFIDDLIHSPEHGRELNAARDRLLSHPELQAWINAVWTQASSAVLEDIADPASRTRALLERALVSIGAALAADEEMQARLDEAIERAARRALSWRGEIAGFIAEVIRSWDAATLASRLEVVIGSDLQYIRMNGTVVGALVGCALFLISRPLS